MTEVLHVLISKIIEYHDSSDCTDEETIIRLHGIFTTEGLQKYKEEIRKLRTILPMNSLFIIPLDRFLEKGMKL